VDADPDDTVIRPRTEESAAPVVDPSERIADTDDTIVHAPQAQPPAEPGSDADAEFADTPRIDHATGLPVLPDLLEVPRAPDTVPVQVIGYALRIGAEVVPLDREVLVGRNPAPPRIQSGEAPRLVIVPSPTSDVSRTHLSVRQLGASVIITDLRSTNGSRVEVPGSALRILRGGESMVVSVGTRIDIGDGTVIDVARLQPGGFEPANEGTP
jgi:hypothetical protein